MEALAKTVASESIELIQTFSRICFAVFVRLLHAFRTNIVINIAVYGVKMRQSVFHQLQYCHSQLCRGRI